MDVDNQLLLDQGAVSQQVVEQMASGAIKASKADYAIAVVVLQGPAAAQNKTRWHGVDMLVRPNNNFSQRYLFDGDRNAIRKQVLKFLCKNCCIRSLNRLLYHIQYC